MPCVIDARRLAHPEHCYLQMKVWSLVILTDPPGRLYVVSLVILPSITVEQM